jgi:hypothetical protein
VNYLKFIMLLSVFLINGCTNSHGARNLHSPASNYSVQMAAYSYKADDGSFYADWIADAIAPVKLQCKSERIAPDGEAQGDKANPLLIPLLATVAKQIYVSSVAKAEKELEVLKKSSTKSYSHTFFTDTNYLQGIDCIVIRRSSKDTNNQDVPNLVAILKLSSILEDSSAFYIEPIWVKASNAIVPTQKKNPTINVSFAISLKTIAPNDSGVQVVNEFGSAAMTVSGLKTDNTTTKCNNIADRCAPSGLLPHQPNKKPISLSIAVTEQGNLGIDFDTRKAELAALKEAYGTAIYDGVKAALE